MAFYWVIGLISKISAGFKPFFYWVAIGSYWVIGLIWRISAGLMAILRKVDKKQATNTKALFCACFARCVSALSWVAIRGRWLPRLYARLYGRAMPCQASTKQANNARPCGRPAWCWGWGAPRGRGGCFLAGGAGKNARRARAGRG